MLQQAHELVHELVHELEELGYSVTDIKSAVDRKDPTGRDEEYYLHDAVRKGDLRKVRFILSAEGVDASPQDQYSDTPLLLAVKEGKDKVVTA